MISWFVLGASALAQGYQPSPAVVDHIGLYVADPAKSAAFYRRILGLRPLDQSASATMRWVGSASFQLHLIGGRTKPVDKTTETHFAFRVRDLKQELKVLDGERVPWTDSDGAPHKITKRFDGVLQVYFFDPDGYSIEVNQAPD
jgi:lactoylglutathione lyase